MNSIFCGGFFASLLISLLFGRAEGLLPTMLEASGNAISLSITLAGGYALWCGIVNVLKRAGIMKLLSNLLAKPLQFLFPGVARGSAAAQAIAVNFAANMLGVGNAATPAGLEAISHMRALAPNGDSASDDIVMLLTVNCSSIQIIPTTVIALRAAAGAAQPSDILLPTVISTAISTLVAIILTKAFSRIRA